MRDVTAAILQKEGRYLIARRKPGGTQGGKWEFPGGKVDPGETPPQGLARELREEFEIQVKVGDLLCTHPFRNGDTDYRLMAYAVEYIAGDFVLHEHTEIRWVTPTAFAGFDFSASDRAVIEKIF